MVLTAPIKARSDATLIAVGMMLNFPAYEWQQKYKNVCGNSENHDLKYIPMATFF